MPKSVSDIRRPEIVASVLEAVRKSGLPFPSYDAVAREAGMSRQLVRHYFPEPEALMVMACDALAGAYKEGLARGVLAANKGKRLDLLLDFYFGFLSEEGLPKPADDLVYDAMFAIASCSPRVRDALSVQYRQLQFAVAHETRLSHPNLPQRACDEIGFIFVSLMYGHWKMVASLGFDRANSRLAREAMDRVIESYLARHPETAPLRDAAPVPQQA